jgi:hypothetical protein
MAKKITIPLTDHEDNCTGYYLVEYKLTGESGYTSFNAYSDQVVINNLADDSTYDVRITRNCCSGIVSAPLLLTVDTSTVSPELDVPDNLVLTPDDTEIAADCDNVTDAELYVWHIAKDDEFTVNFQEVVTTMSNHSFTALDNDVLYYVRVKARASGYADSEWTATETATPAP